MAESEDEDEETSHNRNNKLLIKTMTAKMEQIMNTKIECFRQELRRRTDRESSSQVHTKETGSRNPGYKRCDYKSKSLTFSGSSKDPEVYLRWETSMKQWLRANNIPKEDELSYAVGNLVGDAHKWWLKANTRTFYNYPVQDWRDLKSRMYEEFVKKHQTRSNLTTNSMYQARTRSGLSQPAPRSEPIYYSKPREVLTNTTKKQGKAATTNGNEKVLKLETHSTFKEEMDKSKNLLNTSFSMIKHSSCPKVVEAGLGTKENEKARRKPPEIQTHVHQVIEGEKYRPASLETCKEVIEVEPKELKEYEESSNTRLLVPKPISKQKEQVTSSVISCAENFQTICLMHLSTPRELEKGIGTKEELNSTKDEPKALAELQQFQDVVSEQRSDHVIIYDTRSMDQRPNVLVQTETFHLVFSDLMTDLTHLSSAKGVEKISGTKETITEQDEALKTKEFLNQNQSHGDTTNKLNGIATRDDESADDTIQIKEEPPDANLKAITKLRENYHTNPSHTHTRGKYLNSLTVCDSNLFYLSADNGELIISKESKQKPWKYAVQTLLIKEEPPDAQQRKREMPCKIRDFTIVDEAPPWNQIHGVPHSMLMKEEPPDLLKHFWISKPSQLHLQGKYNVSPNFNVSDLVPFVAEQTDLRTNLFQVGEDDACMDMDKLVAEDSIEHREGEQLVAEDAINLPTGPVTRSRTKQHNQTVESLVNQIKTQNHKQEGMLMLIQAN